MKLGACLKKRLEKLGLDLSHSLLFALQLLQQISGGRGSPIHIYLEGRLVCGEGQEVLPVGAELSEKAGRLLHIDNGEVGEHALVKLSGHMQVGARLAVTVYLPIGQPDDDVLGRHPPLLNKRLHGCILLITIQKTAQQTDHNNSIKKKVGYVVVKRKAALPNLTFTYVDNVNQLSKTKSLHGRKTQIYLNLISRLLNVYVPKLHKM